MIALRTAASMLQAVQGGLHPTLTPIIEKRIAQLNVDLDRDLGEVVHFIVVEPGDQPDQLDRELGFPFLTNLLDGTRFGEPDFTPSFEWIQDHGCWFEIVFMLTDEFGIAVFLQDDPGMHFDLHMFCLEYAGRQY